MRRFYEIKSRYSQCSDRLPQSHPLHHSGFGMEETVWEVASCLADGLYFPTRYRTLGLDYLDDFEQKKTHWALGAVVARFLFGQKGFDLVAGHCSHSGYELSKLYKPDKYSWYIAPVWWLWWNNLVEPKLAINCCSSMDAIRKFRAMVRESVESGKFKSTHEMYMRRREGKENEPQREDR